MNRDSSTRLATSIGAVTLLGAATLLGATRGLAQSPAPGFADPVLGRWDLTVVTNDEIYPSWLELRLRTESELMGRFVGRFGSVRYLESIRYDAGRLEFIAPVQYEAATGSLTFSGTLAAGRLEGTTRGPMGARASWRGVRAPPLPAAESAPGPMMTLFNGEDLSGWRPRSDAHPGCWRADGGELVATPPCVDLVTERAFDDFALHLELNYPAGSNSGVYLRGRYEVQIQDDAGKALDPLRMGGVYGFLTPAVDAAREAGVWQTLDVTLAGRFVTVVLNGTTIIDAREVPGITGGALDSDEGAPGPLMLQGDHGPIRFRNIRLTPLR